jgi:hypothetical protein
MLLFYPGGVTNITRNYPGIANAINGNCDAGDITYARPVGRDCRGLHPLKRTRAFGPERSRRYS